MTQTATKYIAYIGGDRTESDHDMRGEFPTPAKAIEWVEEHRGPVGDCVIVSDPPGFRCVL